EGEAGLPDALRGQDDVDSSARAEVEDGLALPELGDPRRIAAAERGKGGTVRKVAALLGGVERHAEVLARGALAAGAVSAAAAVFGHGNRGLGVLAPDRVAQGVGGSHRRASSRSRARSTSPARRVPASGVSVKYAHLPRCSRSRRAGVTTRFQRS